MSAWNKIRGAVVGAATLGASGAFAGHLWDQAHQNPGDPNYASNLLAAIRRDQWADYKDRFVPIEDALVKEALNPDYAGRTAEASKRVNTAYDVSQGEMNDQLHSYGLEMTPGQKTSYERHSNLSRGLADVEAQNRTRANIRDEQYQILTGTAGRSSTTLGA